MTGLLCDDPDHRGLRRLITERPPLTADDVRWAGPDVQALYFEREALRAEVQALRSGQPAGSYWLRDLVGVLAIAAVVALVAYWLLAPTADARALSFGLLLFVLFLCAAFELGLALGERRVLPRTEGATDRASRVA